MAKRFEAVEALGHESGQAGIPYQISSIFVGLARAIGDASV